MQAREKNIRFSRVGLSLYRFFTCFFYSKKAFSKKLFPVDIVVPLDCKLCLQPSDKLCLS
jgi:hypothetical protein